MYRNVITVVFVLVLLGLVGYFGFGLGKLEPAAYDIPKGTDREGKQIVFLQNGTVVSSKHRSNVPDGDKVYVMWPETIQEVSRKHPDLTERMCSNHSMLTGIYVQTQYFLNGVSEDKEYRRARKTDIDKFNCNVRGGLKK
jgi:hypothetical protein